MLVLPDPIVRCALRKVPAVKGEAPTHQARDSAQDSFFACSISSFLEDVNAYFWNSAERAAGFARTIEEERFLRSLIENPSRMKMEINVLTEFRHSLEGSSFVELGKDNAADLILLVT